MKQAIKECLISKIKYDLSTFERVTNSELSIVRYEFFDQIRELEIEENKRLVLKKIQPALEKELEIEELQKISQILKDEIKLARECLNKLNHERVICY